MGDSPSGNCVLIISGMEIPRISGGSISAHFVVRVNVDKKQIAQKFFPLLSKYIQLNILLRYSIISQAVTEINLRLNPH